MVFLDSLKISLSHTLAGILIFALIYWFAWAVYARCFHPLAHIPGPFLASISRMWLFFEVVREEAEKTQLRMHEELGPVVRIAPNEVSIADPGALSQIYSVNGGFTKTDFYTPFQPSWARFPVHFCSLDEKEHSMRRRVVNSLYSMSNILRSEEAVDTCIEMFMIKLESCVEAGATIDLASWVQWYAFDVVGQLFFSQMFGFLEHGDDHRGYIHALDALLPIIATTLVMPSYARPFYMFGGALVPKIFRALKGIKEIETATDQCLLNRQRMSENGALLSKPDILQNLFELLKTKSEHEFGMNEIKVEVYTAFIAGSDTSAAAISSILYHLMKNPGAYYKLMEEIDEATRSGYLSIPILRYNEAVKLRYLDACCKEGMRLHPSVSMTLPRHVPPEGCAIAGTWFPCGTRVGVNAYVLHRDKSIFGLDADAFNPERWFREDALNMEKYLFQFGRGSRTCIGKNIALCEIYKLVPQVLRSFHFRLAEPDTEWKTHNFWFNKPTDIHTIAISR